MNRYMGFDDELDDDLLTPYTSVSDRDPLPEPDLSITEDDIVAPPIQSKPNDAVKAAIMKRQGMSAPSDEFLSDPLMQNYESNQKDMNQLREAKRSADFIGNLGQSFAQIAQGSSTPKSNTGLYENLSKQNEGMLKSQEEDLDRKQKIVSAIEARKGRQFVASENRKMREAALSAAQGNKDRTRNVQVNRILGMTEKELREDPIAKPSEINLASLGKSQAVLDNTSVPLTSQLLSDAEQDAASAMQLRGQGATEGKIQRTELVTLGRKIAEAKQKWGNKIVDLRVAEPELVAQIKKMNQALIDDYKTTIADRKHSILDDKEAIWGDDPVFAGKLTALRGSISKRFGNRPADQSERQASRGQAPMSPPMSGGQNSGGLINSANAGDGSKQAVKKLYSASRNQTKIIYSDGTEELVDGKK